MAEQITESQRKADEAAGQRRRVNEQTTDSLRRAFDVGRAPQESQPGTVEEKDT